MDGLNLSEKDKHTHEHNKLFTMFEGKGGLYFLSLRSSLFMIVKNIFS